MKNLKFLVLLFCTAGLFGVNTAFAHTHMDPGLTATVRDASASLEDFVKHAASHLSEATSFEGVLQLLKEFRNENGDWNDGSTYLILLTRGGGVYIHPKSREVEDQDWSELLSGCSQGSWHDLVTAGGGCVEGQGEGSRGYAVSFSAPYIPFANSRSKEKDFVLVGGLDYMPKADTPASFKKMVDDLVDSYVRRLIGSDVDLDDPAISQSRMEFRDSFFALVVPEIDSRDVSGEEDLKQFLEKAYSLMTASFSVDLFDPVILRRVFRFEGGPWRNDSTYIYIMDDKGNTIFNGANRDIEQTNLLHDHGPEIARIAVDIRAAAMTRTEDGNSFVGGFVNYNWDDPAVIGDEGDGRPGGSSPKLAFVKAFTVAVDKDKPVDNPRIYIFGSGLYLGGLQGDDGDGGCVIAGTENSLGSTVVNLLLVVSGIFFVAFIRHKS